jgi:hypothetical protein
MSLLLLFHQSDLIAPVISVSNLSATKISRVNGNDITYVSFNVNEECKAWKAKLVATSGAAHTDGFLIDSGGAVPANTLYVFDITDDELVDAGGAEGNNTVKVFVQDDAGNWSE